MMMKARTELLSRYKRYYQPILNLNIHTSYMKVHHIITVYSDKSDNEQLNNISSYRPYTGIRIHRMYSQRVST